MHNFCLGNNQKVAKAVQMPRETDPPNLMNGSCSPMAATGRFFSRARRRKATAGIVTATLELLVCPGSLGVVGRGRCAPARASRRTLRAQPAVRSAERAHRIAVRFRSTQGE